MNNKISRKVIACVLAMVMLFGTCASVFAAAADSDYDYPVIVVNGIADNPLYANPNTSAAAVVFPPSDMEIAFEFGEMMTLGIAAIASDNRQDYEAIMNYFVGSQVYEKFNAIQLQPDGTSMAENIGPNVYEYALSYYYTDSEIYGAVAGDIGIGIADRIGADNVYVYTYDWRLDPLVTAEGLHNFIQNVKSKAKTDKVSIISEGYGATVATTYLAIYHDDATADVDNFVTVNSAFEGSSLIGDLFTGRLASAYKEVQNTSSAFIRYINDISDNPFTWLAGWITLYVLNRNWEIQDFVADVLTMMGNILDPLYDRYLRDLLKNFTGLWAMVPVEYYEEAMDFMFIDDTSTSELYNSEYQEKLQTFKNIQESAKRPDGFLAMAKSEGINVSVVSCWDIQLVPIGDNSASVDEVFGLSAQSDGFIDTYYSSFGAFTIPLNDVGAAIQNKEQKNTFGECANHNHMSSVYDYLDPEHDLGGIAHYIDASTCALPDNTWFIRNMKYGTFDTASDSMDFLNWLVTAEKSTTVYSSVLWPQFMTYHRYIKPGYINSLIPSKNPQYLLGDVNLDGVITAADARLALRISARLEEYPNAGSAVFRNADVNGDGVITAADARIILRVSAGLASFDDYRNTSDK